MNWKMIFSLLVLFLKIKGVLKDQVAVCVYVSPLSIMELEQTAVERQRLDKQVPVATNTHATIELLGEVFSLRIRIISNTQYVAKGKQAISSFPNLSFP
jgi:hypothetical protein